jgi:predicted kinase
LEPDRVAKPPVDELPFVSRRSLVSVRSSTGWHHCEDVPAARNTTAPESEVSMEDPGNGSRPALILVSGMPASGKSTLAKELAAELRVPLFIKDDLKEILFDAGGYAEETMDEATSDRFGSQSMAMLYYNAQRLLDAGVSVLLEANFQADLAEEQIEPFLTMADVRQVYCQLPLELIKERFQERQNRDERHPVHAGIDDVDQLARDLERKNYGPIELDIPTLIVDTSYGFDPPIDEIVRFCRDVVPAS